MNEFQARENEGRKKWLDLNINDILNGKKVIAFTEDKYCNWDFEQTGKTNIEYYGEIKDVHRRFDRYDNFQVDLKKLIALCDACKDEGRTPLFVAFFEELAIVWDLTNIPFEERARPVECTSTTATNYEHAKKTKIETFLYESEAMYIKRYQLDN